MQTPPDIFFHLTATGWTAIGSMVGAISIVALVVFNVLTLRAAFRTMRAAEAQASVAETSLDLLKNQLALTQRPFIAIHSEFCEELSACLVYAHNQGNGPALEVEASLTYDEDSTHTNEYSVGCMAVDEKFQFLIGDRSKNLCAATIWYKSISDENWTTKITLLAGHPAVTDVTRGQQDNDGKLRRIQNVLARATQTEE